MSLDIDYLLKIAQGRSLAKRCDRLMRERLDSPFGTVHQSSGFGDGEAEIIAAHQYGSLALGEGCNRVAHRYRPVVIWWQKFPRNRLQSRPGPPLSCPSRAPPRGGHLRSRGPASRRAVVVRPRKKSPAQPLPRSPLSNLYERSSGWIGLPSPSWSVDPYSRGKDTRLTWRLSRHSPRRRPP